MPAHKTSTKITKIINILSEMYNIIDPKKQLFAPEYITKHEHKHLTRYAKKFYDFYGKHFTAIIDLNPNLNDLKEMDEFSGALLYNLTERGEEIVRDFIECDIKNIRSYFIDMHNLAIDVESEKSAV